MMKKNHIRDYATAAYRFWAMTPGGAAAYKKKIWDDAILRQHREEGRSGISNPSEAAVIHAEMALDRKAAEIQDLEAVEQAINQIEHMPKDGKSIMAALRIIYMAEPEREPERGEISERVHKAELDIPASERNLYRWLAFARRLFAEARGLRL